MLFLMYIMLRHDNNIQIYLEQFRLQAFIETCWVTTEPMIIQKQKNKSQHAQSSKSNEMQPRNNIYTNNVQNQYLADALGCQMSHSLCTIKQNQNKYELSRVSNSIHSNFTNIQTNNKPGSKIKMYGSKKSLLAYSILLNGNETEKLGMGKQKQMYKKIEEVEKEKQLCKLGSVKIMQQNNLPKIQHHLSNHQQKKKKVIGSRKNISAIIALIEPVDAWNKYSKQNYHQQNSKTNKIGKQNEALKLKIVGRQKPSAFQIQQIKQKNKALIKGQGKHDIISTFESGANQPQKQGQQTKQIQSIIFQRQERSYEKNVKSHKNKQQSSVQSKQVEQNNIAYNIIESCKRQQNGSIVHFAMTSSECNNNDGLNICMNQALSSHFRTSILPQKSGRLDPVDLSMSNTLKVPVQDGFIYYNKKPSVILTPSKKIKAHVDYVFENQKQVKYMRRGKIFQGTEKNIDHQFRSRQKCQQCQQLESKYLMQKCEVRRNSIKSNLVSIGNDLAQIDEKKMTKTYEDIQNMQEKQEIKQLKQTRGRIQQKGDEQNNSKINSETSIEKVQLALGDKSSGLVEGSARANNLKENTSVLISDTQIITHFNKAQDNKQQSKSSIKGIIQIVDDGENIEHNIAQQANFNNFVAQLEAKQTRERIPDQIFNFTQQHTKNNIIKEIDAEYVYGACVRQFYQQVVMKQISYQNHCNIDDWDGRIIQDACGKHKEHTIHINNDVILQKDEKNSNNDDRAELLINRDVVDVQIINDDEKPNTLIHKQYQQLNQQNGNQDMHSLSLGQFSILAPETNQQIELNQDLKFMVDAKEIVPSQQNAIQQQAQQSEQILDNQSRQSSICQEVVKAISKESDLDLMHDLEQAYRKQQSNNIPVNASGGLSLFNQNHCQVKTVCNQIVNQFPSWQQQQNSAQKKQQKADASGKKYPFELGNENENKDQINQHVVENTQRKCPGTLLLSSIGKLESNCQMVKININACSSINSLIQHELTLNGNELIGNGVKKQKQYVNCQNSLQQVVLHENLSHPLQSRSQNLRTLDENSPRSYSSISQQQKNSGQSYSLQTININQQAKNITKQCRVKQKQVNVFLQNKYPAQNKYFKGSNKSKYINESNCTQQFQQAYGKDQKQKKQQLPFFIHLRKKLKKKIKIPGYFGPTSKSPEGKKQKLQQNTGIYLGDIININKEATSSLNESQAQNNECQVFEQKKQRKHNKLFNPNQMAKLTIQYECASKKYQKMSMNKQNIGQIGQRLCNNTQHNFPCHKTITNTLQQRKHHSNWIPQASRNVELKQNKKVIENGMNVQEKFKRNSYTLVKNRQFGSDSFSVQVRREHQI